MCVICVLSTNDSLFIFFEFTHGQFPEITSRWISIYVIIFLRLIFSTTSLRECLISCYLDLFFHSNIFYIYYFNPYTIKCEDWFYLHVFGLNGSMYFVGFLTVYIFCCQNVLWHVVCCLLSLETLSYLFVYSETNVVDDETFPKVWGLSRFVWKTQLLS